MLRKSVVICAQVKVVMNSVNNCIYYFCALGKTLNIFVLAWGIPQLQSQEVWIFPQCPQTIDALQSGEGDYDKKHEIQRT